MLYIVVGMSNSCSNVVKCFVSPTSIKSACRVGRFLSLMSSVDEEPENPINHTELVLSSTSVIP